MKVYHELKPVYNEKSEILILGSIPSVKSREIGFYYGHPQNRFWRILADILKEPLPETIQDKKELLYKYNIALWDVLKECEITGSSDSSIKNPVPNDIKSLIKKTNIKTVFVTGKVAEKFYNKFCLDKTGIPCIYLPSTSPANASIKYATLLNNYKIILNYLDKNY